MGPRLTAPRPLARPFAHVGGHGYTAWLPDLAEGSDDLDHPRRSRLVVFEDGQPLQRPHSMHEDIRVRGGGRHSHWRDALYFSSSDGSDPNRNGRTYAVTLLPDTDDAFFHAHVGQRERAACAEVMRLATDCGQMGIVDTLDRLMGLRGRRVLEIGCGHCWYAPEFLRRGATSFFGTDPYKNFDIDLVYDYRGHRAGSWMNAYQRAGMTMREFLGHYRNITLSHEPIEAIPVSEARFDAACMISVTEHLRHPRESFARIADLMAPGGYLYITHHNYYGWNGHHREPKFADEINLSDPSQQRVVDWNHLRRGLLNFDEDAGNYLNFIRLHELAAALQEFFTIEWWELQPSPEARGGGRLTPEIRAALPQYYAEELTTEVAAYLCRRPR